MIYFFGKIFKVKSILQLGIIKHHCLTCWDNIYSNNPTDSHTEATGYYLHMPNKQNMLVSMSAAPQKQKRE